MERTISAVLSTLPFGPKIDRKVEEAFAPAKVYHVGGKDNRGIAEVIGKVEVAVLPSDLDAMLPACDFVALCCYLIITPHFTPKAENFGEDSIKVLLENLARYRRGEPLKNQMQPRDILTKQKLY